MTQNREIMFEKMMQEIDTSTLTIPGVKSMETRLLERIDALETRVDILTRHIYEEHQAQKAAEMLRRSHEEMMQETETLREKKPHPLDMVEIALMDEAMPEWLKDTEYESVAEYNEAYEKYVTQPLLDALERQGKTTEEKDVMYFWNDRHNLSDNED